MSFTETLKSRLEETQCHFTWDLKTSRQNLIYLRERFKGDNKHERNIWLAHIYNLQGLIQHKLGSNEEALKCFNQATKTLQRQKNTDEGPWLMVNFGNLAWLHYLMNEDEKSHDYLSKVEDLMKKYPVPPVEELHPEVCAEKAWTLIKFDREKKQQAAELFKRAMQMEPENVEWHSSCALLTAKILEENIKKLYADRLQELKAAKERDPNNLCVAALYLGAKATSIKHEARELAERILDRPVNNYCGIDQLLSLYTKHISADEAVEIVKEALGRNPDSLYVKKSAAKWFAKKIFTQQDNHNPERIKEVISLCEEVIGSYPKSSLREKLTLADVYAKIDREKADQLYNELLERDDLDPAAKQMLYCRYAKHLYFSRNDGKKSRDCGRIKVSAEEHRSAGEDLKEKRRP